MGGLEFAVLYFALVGLLAIFLEIAVKHPSAFREMAESTEAFARRPVVRAAVEDPHGLVLRPRPRRADNDRADLVRAHSETRARSGLVRAIRH